MGKIGRCLGVPLAGLLLAANGAGPAAAQQLSGSLEAGLQTLAQTLLAGLPQQGRPSLSVMPFPAADQACSVLSVFVVDELTTTLIGAVTPRPRVVERQQLETIIAQERLDEFLTDPEQRRRLGGKSGIGALVVGTYAVIGDRVRLNARLVAIESGEAIAAAAVSVPRTSELSELLRQDAGRGRKCAAPTVARRSAEFFQGRVPRRPRRCAVPRHRKGAASRMGCGSASAACAATARTRRRCSTSRTPAAATSLWRWSAPPRRWWTRTAVRLRRARLPGCRSAGNSMAGAYMTANSQAGCLSGSILDHRQNPCHPRRRSGGDRPDLPGQFAIRRLGGVPTCSAPPSRCSPSLRRAVAMQRHGSTRRRST